MNREQIINQYISVYEGHAMEKEELEIMLNGFADDIVNNLQPSLPSNLDEAAEEYIKEGKYLPESFVVRPAFIAGAEWMEKEINKELIKAMEKVHEIRDVDYDIHIDTSTDGSFETISYYENGKLVGQEQSKKTE